MKLPDTNLLIYCVDGRSPFCATATAWLQRAFQEPGGVAFAWNAVIGFVRIATHRTFLTAPLSIADAMAIVDEWLAHPHAHMVHPTARHPDLLFKFLSQAGSAGNLTNDAHLAALAVEHGARVGTFDRDFARFRGVDVDLLS